MATLKFLARITLTRLPMPVNLGDSTPRSEGTWEVKTWIPAPVVNPLIKDSDNRELRTPRLRRPMPN